MVAGPQPGHSSLQAVISVIHQKLTKLHPKDGASQVHQVAVKVKHVDSVPAQQGRLTACQGFVCTMEMQTERYAGCLYDLGHGHNEGIHLCSLSPDVCNTATHARWLQWCQCVLLKV